MIKKKTIKRIIFWILFLTFIGLGFYLRVEYPTVYDPSQPRRIYMGTN